MLTASQAPDEAILKMAKFALVVDDWMKSLSITATAIQCWSSLQKNFGVNVCTIMSMMSEQMLPSACEVDIAGVVGMYALQLASGTSERAGGLEQQLRQRSGEMRVLPLRQLGQGLSAGYSHCHCADSGNNTGRGEHIWCARGPHGAWSGDIRPREHRRSDRERSQPTSAKESLPTIRSTHLARAPWSRCTGCRR